MNSLTELENTYRGNCFVLTSDALSMASKEALVKLKDAMSDSGKSVEDLFKEIDADGDGTINGPELYKGIKNIAGKALTPSQISMIITCLLYTSPSPRD